MMVSIAWDGNISYLLQSIVTVLVMTIGAMGCFVFAKSKRYGKFRGRNYYEKQKLKATGYYFMLFVIFLAVLQVTMYIIINEPNLVYLISFGVLAVVLFFLDGWITNKLAVKNKRAIETNPIMGFAMKHVNFRWIRAIILLGVASYVIYLCVSSDIMPIFIICFIGLVVCVNNIVHWISINKSQKLRNLVNREELGFDDLHEM